MEIFVSFSIFPFSSYFSTSSSYYFWEVKSPYYSFWHFSFIFPHFSSLASNTFQTSCTDYNTSTNSQAYQTLKLGMISKRSLIMVHFPVHAWSKAEEKLVEPAHKPEDGAQSTKKKMWEKIRWKSKQSKTKRTKTVLRKTAAQKGRQPLRWRTDEIELHTFNVVERMKRREKCGFAAPFFVSVWLWEKTTVGLRYFCCMQSTARP